MARFNPAFAPLCHAACGEAALPALSSLHISDFQNLSFLAFTINSPLPNNSREGNHSSVVKFTIFFQGSSARFSASGRSTCFFEIRPLHSVKICILAPFPLTPFPRSRQREIHCGNKRRTSPPTTQRDHPPARPTRAALQRLKEPQKQSKTIPASFCARPQMAP